jgi:hypothetical protein
LKSTFCEVQVTTSANYTVIVPGSAGGTAGMIGSYADSAALATMTAALGAAPKMALTYVDSGQPSWSLSW